MQESKARLEAFRANNASEAKEYLCKSLREKANHPKYLVQADRYDVIQPFESEMILKRTFQYIVALIDMVLVTIKFHMNHHFVVNFKRNFREEFSGTKVLYAFDWNSYSKEDENLKAELKRVEETMAEVEAAVITLRRF